MRIPGVLGKEVVVDVENDGHAPCLGSLTLARLTLTDILVKVDNAAFRLFRLRRGGM